jgi:hypothetical protein
VKLTPDEAKDFDETDSDLPSLTAMNHPEKQAKSRRGSSFTKNKQPDLLGCGLNYLLSA